MGSIEGGAFSCKLHNFTTENVQDWDEHCFGDPDHTLKVQKICINCAEEGIRTEFVEEAVPYPKKFVEKSHSKQFPGIQLPCPKCGELT
jgi:hypothetical protein